MLGAIPGLDALIEGHLRSNAGRAVLKAVKDGSQQDALIQRWQSSNLFKTFFPNAGCEGTTAGSVAGGEDAEDEDAQTDLYSASITGQKPQKQQDNYQIPPLPSPQQQRQIQQQQQQQLLSQISPMSPGFLFGGLNQPVDTKNFMVQQQQQFPAHRGSTSLSDIVANDAARS